MKAALILCSALVLGASAASACVPDPTKSTYDHILIGNTSGADMSNGFKVVVRDVGNVPLAGVAVTITFLGSGARADLEQEAGSTTNCSAGSLTRISDGAGEVTFHARIAGHDATRMIQVRANGVLFGSIEARSTDLDGDGTTGLRDLNAFRERFVQGTTASETDLNHDGVTNGYDFALFRAEFVRGASNSVCP